MSFQERKFGLDIIRATAIVSVLLCHNIQVFYPFVSGKAEVLFNYTMWWGGFFGVEMFFVLSGFLIGTIFIDKVVKPAAEDTQSTRVLVTDFWIRRWLRTLPAYYLFVLINYLLIPISGEKHSVSGLFKCIFFLQGLSGPGAGFFGVSWSLAIEEWFYLLLPVLFLIGLNASGKQKARQSFVFAMTMLLLIPLTIKARYVFSLPAKADVEHVFHYHTFYKLDSIFYGVLFAWLWQREDIRVWLVRNKSRLFWLGISGLAVSSAYAFLFLVKPLQSPVLVLLFGPLCSVSVACCLPLLVEFKPANPASRAVRALTEISLVSYSLYLCHVPIIILAAAGTAALGLQMTFATALCVFLLQTAAAYLAAKALFHYFELPILKTRELLSKQLRRTKTNAR